MFSTFLFSYSTAMSIILNNIKLYSSLLLPVCLFKSIYSITYYIIDSHPFGIARSTFALLLIILFFFPGPQHKILYIILSLPVHKLWLTLTLIFVYNSVYSYNQRWPYMPKWVDYALQDPLFTASENRKKADSSTVMPVKGNLATHINGPFLA